MSNERGMGEVVARVNVEDSIFKENRFVELAIALGGRVQAVGALVCAFFVAQRFWFPHKSRIPRAVWDKEKLPDALIDTDWAVEENGEIYVRGSEEQFSWLFQKQQAGKRSAEIKRKSDQQPLTSVERPSTSLLFSHSSFLSSQDSSSELVSQNASVSGPCDLALAEHEAKVSRSRKPNPLNIATWEAYAEAYKTRYGEPPIRNAAINSKVSQLVQRLGEESPGVAKFYVSHNDSFYVRSMHPVGLLLRDAEKLRTEWATGRRMTANAARSAETQDHFQDQMRRIAEGTL